MEFCFLNDFCDSTNFTHRYEFYESEMGTQIFYWLRFLFQAATKDFSYSATQIRYFVSFRPKIINKKIGKALRKITLSLKTKKFSFTVLCKVSVFEFIFKRMRTVLEWQWNKLEWLAAQDSKRYRSECTWKICANKTAICQCHESFVELL